LAPADVLFDIGLDLEGELLALELGVALERFGLGLRGDEELLRLRVGQNGRLAAALLREAHSQKDAGHDAQGEADEDIDHQRSLRRWGLVVRRAPASVTTMSTCSSPAWTGTAGTI